MAPSYSSSTTPSSSRSSADVTASTSRGGSSYARRSGIDSYLPATGVADDVDFMHRYASRRGWWYGSQTFNLYCLACCCCACLIPGAVLVPLAASSVFEDNDSAPIVIYIVAAALFCVGFSYCCCWALRDVWCGGVCGAPPAEPLTKMWSKPPRYLQAPPRRVHFIVNPWSGLKQGRNQAQLMRDLCADHNIDVVSFQFTEGIQHATALALALDLTDIDAICVCGGDGTVFEVVNGLMQRFTRDGEAIPPLCVVPLGTSNASGDALGFFVEGKFDVCVRNAIEAMAAGRVTDPDCLMIDLGNSTVIYACQSLTWGAINDVLYTTDCIRCMGPRRYLVGSLWELIKGRHEESSLAIDGAAAKDYDSAVTMMYTSQNSPGMRLAPEAVMDDGKVDAILMRPGRRGYQLQGFMHLENGSYIRHPLVEYRQLETIVIRRDNVDPAERVIFVDGEAVSHGEEIRATVKKLPFPFFVGDGLWEAADLAA